MVVQGIHKVLISEHGQKKALPSCYRFTLLYSSTILGSREKFQWFLKDDNYFFNLTSKMTICPLGQYKSCSVSFWILFWNCFRILEFFHCIWICSLTMVSAIQHEFVALTLAHKGFSVNDQYVSLVLKFWKFALYPAAQLVSHSYWKRRTLCLKYKSQAQPQAIKTGTRVYKQWHASVPHRLFIKQ